MVFKPFFWTSNSFQFLSFFLFLLSLSLLSFLENSPPIQIEVKLPGGIPGTMFLPSSIRHFPSTLPHVSSSALSPVVLLVHGFASDRSLMNSLARRLAKNNYAALTIDLRGHGSNPHWWSLDFLGLYRDSLFSDLASAIQFLKSPNWSKYFNSSQIALVGHSMGACAVLEYSMAANETEIASSIMVAGGFSIYQNKLPANGLFIYGSWDIDFVKKSVPPIFSHLKEANKLNPGQSSSSLLEQKEKLITNNIGTETNTNTNTNDNNLLMEDLTYGSFENKTALKLKMFSYLDHTWILFSKAVAIEILNWLDSSFQIKRGSDFDLDDHRVSVSLLCCSLLLLSFLGLGKLIGHLSPKVEFIAPGDGVENNSWISKKNDQIWHGALDDPGEVEAEEGMARKKATSRSTKKDDLSFLVSMGDFFDRHQDQEHKRGMCLSFAAFFISLFLMSSHTPLFFIPIFGADQVLSYLFISGVLLLLMIKLLDHRKFVDWSMTETQTTAYPKLIFVSFFGFFIFYSAFVPLGVIFHRLTPNLIRMPVLLLCSVFLFPIFFALDLLLRRGSPTKSSLYSLMGKLLLILFLFLAIQLKLINELMVLILPAMAFLFVVMELCAAGIYQTSKNFLVISCVHSLVFGWILAVILPLTAK